MTVDTLSLARELRAADLAGPQAEAIAAAIGRAVTETSATKDDLARVEASLRLEIARLDGKMETKVEALRSSLLSWFVGTQLAVGALVVALVKLIPQG